MMNLLSGQNVETISTSNSTVLDVSFLEITDLHKALDKALL